MSDYLPTALPTPRQLEFQDWEYGLFLHFGIRTFYEGHRDWDGKPMEASAFNPTELDCDDWAATAAEAGMRYVVLTAKHHDGFALWPSEFTDFSVANSPWKDGQGDLIREYVEACRCHGLKVGLYYSPADASKATYADAKAYDDYFIHQVSELLTGYGEIDILWFDGCGSEGHVYDWSRITAEIRRLQPNILLFELGDPDFRWVGNEAGVAPYPLWNTVDRTEFSINALEATELPDGPRWLPAECDFRMRALNWFYSDADEATVKSLPELLGLHYLSIGRGANMLINIGPDRRGKLPDTDRLSLLELRAELQRRFSHPLASLGERTLTQEGLTWRFSKAVLLDHVVLEEDLSEGEHIRRFLIEVGLFPVSDPIVVYEGRNVGHRAICAFPPVRALSVTVRVTESTGDWNFRSAELYNTTGAGGVVSPSRTPGILFRFAEGVGIEGPLFSLDGAPVGNWRFEEIEEDGRWRFVSKDRADAVLRLELRPSANAGLLRFRFHLDASGRLTKPNGKESLRYFSVRLPEAGTLTEIELAHFDTLTNIYKPAVRRYEADERFPRQSWHGPILIHEGVEAVMFAYEHGSDSTLRFLEFAESEGTLELRSVMGGYCDGDVAKLESPWFQLGRATDIDALLRGYRTFQLTELGTPASRTPSIFYNTWNHQERLKYLHGKPYLSEMNLERMLAEVEAAHEMGIEVFVIDTGWYAKTGDWEVNLERFPDGLQEVRRKLEGYGMRLGLWFNPIVAAQTSKVFLDHPEWVMEDSEGRKNFCGPIWETEESWGMCVCSGWADHFAQTLVRLNRELGVSYFKWDAIHLYGCTAAHHDHGGPHNSISERADRYAFESGRSLTRIVETVLKSCPDAIVDFDFTERNRYFGLGFSSVGKMFLVNNGPYFHNFDIPPDHQRIPETINVFFNPGSARPRVCRGGLRFDPFVPSVLYLSHYLPDGPRLAQENSFASLVLGGNGIWGSLPELTPEDRAWWQDNLEAYRQVRLGATRAYPRVVGEPGTSPEIHEKIDVASGSGLICFFTVTKGTFEHVTQVLPTSEPKVTGADEWRVLPNGRLWLRVSLPEQGARVVFIGVDQ